MYLRKGVEIFAFHTRYFGGWHRCLFGFYGYRELSRFNRHCLCVQSNATLKLHRFSSALIAYLVIDVCPSRHQERPYDHYRLSENIRTFQE